MLPSKRIYQRVRTPDQQAQEENQNISVRVKTLDNQSLSVTLRASALVVDLKNILERKLGVRKEKQKIIFQGKVLEGKRRLCECGVGEGAVLNLIAKCNRYLENTQNVEIDEESKGPFSLVFTDFLGDFI